VTPYYAYFESIGLASDLVHFTRQLTSLSPCPAGFAKPTLRTTAARKAVVVRADADATNWLKKDPTVLMASAAGWFIPSNIGVSAFGGKSLFGLFTASIGENMAHFPTGPALDDKFWLYMVTWHLGLFVVMTLGQIGAQGRKQNYW
jgi:photosystem I subunit PsaO